jgi:hypothetical protein
MYSICQFAQRSNYICVYNNIGCDDDQEEEVDSDNMEYTEDAIDNMILEFSGDLYKHESKIKCLFVFFNIVIRLIKKTCGVIIE